MDSEPADSAVQAFEALREEVAALRRGVELVYRQAQQAAPSGSVTPDYSPTLGKMEKALGAIAGRLEAVEGHPALRLTPGAYAQQVATGVRQVKHEAGDGAAHVQEHLSTALGELRAIIGSAHSQGFSRTLRAVVALRGMENTRTEELKTGTPVHGVLQHLQPVDLVLYRTCRPRQVE